MQFNKQSQKLRTRIQELEEELSRVKQQLHETSQEVGNHIFLFWLLTYQTYLQLIPI